MCHRYFIHSKVVWNAKRNSTNTADNVGVDFIWNTGEKLLRCYTVHRYSFYLFKSLVTPVLSC